jgi:hypothetical protein
VHAVTLDPETNILVGHGLFTIGRDPARVPDAVDPLPIMRLYPSGVIDSTFYNNVVSGTSGSVYTLIRLQDGRLLIGGCFGTNELVLRVNADGSRDATFSPFTLGTHGGATQCSQGYTANALALLPDGRIVVGGVFNYDVADLASGMTNLAVLPFDHPPGPETALFAYADGPVYALATEASGDVLIGGDFASVTGHAHMRLARMHADSGATIDDSLTIDADAPVRALASRVDGRFFVGGDFNMIGGAARQHLALVDAAGGVQTNFDYDVNGPVNALALMPDGKIAVGGEFTTVNGIAHSNVVRLQLPDPAWFAIDYVPRRPLPPWIYWNYAGAAPVAALAPELSYSLDGINFVALGPMTRDDIGRWRFETFTPPADQLVFLRVEASTSDGRVRFVQPIFDADRIFADGFDGAP